jgi:peptide/nickel transport system permease protein
VALPAITLQFGAFSELFGGAVLAEQVFSYPGLGQATVEAGLRGDVPLLLGLVIFSAVFVFIGNLLADLLYFVLDPRMREGRRL